MRRGKGGEEREEREGEGGEGGRGKGGEEVYIQIYEHIVLSCSHGVKC